VTMTVLNRGHVVACPTDPVHPRTGGAEATEIIGMHELGRPFAFDILRPVAQNSEVGGAGVAADRLLIQDLHKVGGMLREGAEPLLVRARGVLRLLSLGHIDVTHDDVRGRAIGGGDGHGIDLQPAATPIRAGDLSGDIALWPSCPQRDHGRALREWDDRPIGPSWAPDIVRENLPTHPLQGYAEQVRRRRVGIDHPARRVEHHDPARQRRVDRPQAIRWRALSASQARLPSRSAVIPTYYKVTYV